MDEERYSPALARSAFGMTGQEALLGLAESVHAHLRGASVKPEDEAVRGRFVEELAGLSLQFREYSGDAPGGARESMARRPDAHPFAACAICQPSSEVRRPRRWKLCITEPPPRSGMYAGASSTPSSGCACYGVPPDHTPPKARQGAAPRLMTRIQEW